MSENIFFIIIMITLSVDVDICEMALEINESSAIKVQEWKCQMVNYKPVILSNFANSNIVLVKCSILNVLSANKAPSTFAKE